MVFLLAGLQTDSHQHVSCIACQVDNMFTEKNCYLHLSCFAIRSSLVVQDFESLGYLVHSQCCVGSLPTLTVICTHSQ